VLAFLTSFPLHSRLRKSGFTENAKTVPRWTPLNPSDKPADKVATFGEDTPLGRPAQPEEIAPAFVFFASEADSSYVTGAILTLLGGETSAA